MTNEDKIKERKDTVPMAEYLGRLDELKELIKFGNIFVTEEAYQEILKWEIEDDKVETSP